MSFLEFIGCQVLGSELIAFLLQCTQAGNDGDRLPAIFLVPETLASTGRPACSRLDGGAAFPLLIISTPVILQTSRPFRVYHQRPTCPNPSCRTPFGRFLLASMRAIPCVARHFVRLPASIVVLNIHGLCLEKDPRRGTVVCLTLNSKTGLRV